EARLMPLEDSCADVTELARFLERAVLQDSLARLESEVQPAKARVALLELVHDAPRPHGVTAAGERARRVQVVLETADRAHAGAERILSRVPERRVTEVVREADRLDEVFVQR